MGLFDESRNDPGWGGWDAQGVVVNCISTLILVAALIVTRTMILRWLRRLEIGTHEPSMRWRVQVRNGLWLVFLFGVVTIWAQELKTIALSITALGVAFVIATKELIQCVSGAAIKSSAQAFSVGDRIELEKIRGDVIDHNLLTTTLLEIGPGGLSQQYTGRAVVIPNSKFLDKALINETYSNDYVLHAFAVPCKAGDWQSAEAALMSAASAECQSFIDEASAHFDALMKKKGMDRKPAIEPRVTVTVPKAGEVELVVRVPVPARRKGRIEQAILRRFLEPPTNTGSGNTAPKVDAQITETKIEPGSTG